MTMKTDLAPKYLYYYALFVFILGLITLGFIHQITMDYALRSGEYVPFAFTSVFCVALMLGTMFIFNRCRYIVINAVDQNKFVMGNILSDTHGHGDNLKVIKKVWINLFKVTVEGKVYYIFSFDKTVDEFKQRQSV